MDSVGGLNPADELKAGLLSLSGKLMRFRVSNGGTLTSVPLQGGGKKGSWQLAGQAVRIVPIPARSKPFQFALTIGPKTTLKLEGNSEADMNDWIAAFNQFT